MADPRFFNNAGPFTIAQIAGLTGAEIVGGDAAKPLSDVAPLDKASGNEVSFLDNVKYIDSFRKSAAGACFVHAKHIKQAPESMTLLVCAEPYSAYALAAQQFYPLLPAIGHISGQASIASSAKVGNNCVIDPFAVIGERAEIGEHCHIGAGAVIGAGVTIGRNSSIGANSTLSHCLVGENVIIHRGVHIGQDGFGFALGRTGPIKVPQLGRVVIEDNVEIGSGTCIDRGAGPDTVIGQGTKIDNLVQIGHNVTIGRYSIIVSQVGISGSTHIGAGVMIGGQGGIAGHLRIGNGARVAAQGGVMTDIPDKAAYGGSPAVPVKDWHRQTIAVARLAKRKGAEND
ncbi:MAG TPA: UDP-3-O-(3-hydroxymyristoyl)glucosamine N-acyltransferase [Rickettsiales bacterium]|nr:UDP-3-O-(3-hydroxymyristoyl)glucosamine N-acyltransferase [Rickettsiales bacterium]